MYFTYDPTYLMVILKNGRIYSMFLYEYNREATCGSWPPQKFEKKKIIYLCK